MPNFSTLISRGNSKKLKRNKNTEPPNCNCIKKENCPLKGRCQIECVVYWLKYSIRGVLVTIGMIKKCIWVQCKAFSNKDIMIIKVALHMKYMT